MTGGQRIRCLLSADRLGTETCARKVVFLYAGHHMKEEDHMKKNRLTPEEAWKSYRSDLPVRFRKEEADAFIEVLKKRQAPSAAGENGTSGDPAQDR